jgi:hypothetical protein
MEAWLRAHVHAFEHFGGIPALAVPDNAKTGVTKAHRYDPDLNPTYYNFALHCGFGIVPARPYKPRDEAKVENPVQVAQRWIVTALRHRKFAFPSELVSPSPESAPEIRNSSILIWGYSKGFTETSGQVTMARKSASSCDLNQRDGTASQHFFCPLDAKLYQPLVRGTAHTDAKHT